MDILFLGIVIFLFLLAVVDLSVGVSNDAVNFLSSAIGSRAASFKRVMIVASIGVFIGAALSNGMMDIARHGIFQPENLSFYDVIAIFMAVMVTDIILLDLFNSLGMPRRPPCQWCLSFSAPHLWWLCSRSRLLRARLP